MPDGRRRRWRTGWWTGRDVGVDLALRILGHVRETAAGMGLALAGVVTDRGGHVVASCRMDGAPLGALPIATDKAYTAALWGMRTGDMAEATLPGGGDWGFANTIGGRMIVFAGGVPIEADGTARGRARRERRAGRGGRALRAGRRWRPPDWDNTALSRL